MENFTLPPALEKGDKVAILATSSGIKQRFPAAFEKGIERLESRFDLEPVIFETAKKNTEYLNSNPEQKAEELMKAFEDPEIKGIIPVTGGDEAMRMLKYLEPERIRENPTRFYGISGNTDIEIYLWNLEIQSFYGGQILADLLCGEELGEYTYKYLERAFFEDRIGRVEASKKFTDEFVDPSADQIIDDRHRYENPGWEFWNFDGKTVTGRIWGGCFEIIDWQMSAGKYIPDHSELEGCVLALETSEESPSETEVKRWLMSMGENGILQQFSAIIVGRPVRQDLHGDEITEQEKKEYHQDQKNRFKQEIERYCPDTPVVFDFDLGHTDPKIPVPIGGKVRIDPDKREIEFEA